MAHVKRGTVVRDGRDNLWLCVLAGEEAPTMHRPSPGDENNAATRVALMHCEDTRIDRPVRQFHNLSRPVELISEPERDDL